MGIKVNERQKKLLRPREKFMRSHGFRIAGYNEEVIHVLHMERALRIHTILWYRRSDLKMNLNAVIEIEEGQLLKGVEGSPDPMYRRHGKLFIQTIPEWKDDEQEVLSDSSAVR